MRRFPGAILIAGATAAAAGPAPESAAREIRVAGAHIAVTGDVDANEDAILRGIHYAAAEKADITGDAGVRVERLCGV